jgi:hypothetical protein
MRTDRPRVGNTPAELARRQGCGVQRSFDTSGGRKTFLRYRSLVGQEERFEVNLDSVFLQ